MSGAAVLATKAALRCGVGLARVLTPEANRTVLQATVPEAIVSPCDTPSEVMANTDTDGLVLGCGLGTTSAAGACLRSLLCLFPDIDSLPTVLDADGLNLLAGDASLWDTPLLSSPARQVVITPHPAEMSRLCGKPVSVILADPVGTARDFARERGVTVVLKDAHTVIASPDGRLFLCTAGNAGMAKGGSGDVLAGVIGALLVQNRGRLGQELTVAEVAAAGVYLHAAAGDLTARQLGEYGMLAGDLIECLPLVSRHLSDSRTVIGGI
jgi:NAD(P)H-hydrate epimerase